jgi:sulfide:quinone oxidoreductase
MNDKKHIVIVGAGTAGTMLGNKLAKNKEIMVTIVDPAVDHYYQPGFLFYPFGKYSLEDLRKPSSDVIHKNVLHVNQSVTRIDADNKIVTTEDGTTISYDALVVATGTRIDPSLTEGLVGEGWQKNIFDFYTPDGADLLRGALQAFTGGRLVVQITEMPIKCPVAPLEFAFLADDYFKKRGIRESVEIVLVTPLSGAFTKPVASEKLGHLLTEKNIAVVTDFYTEKIVSAENTVYCYDGRTIDYDLLVTIPTNVGTALLQELDFTDDLGFVEVDAHTLQSTKRPDIFAIGDTTNVATSKAGSVAHFEAHVVEENILSFLSGEPLSAQFDGHSNCFVEMGGGKALLLDFNYETQPYEGTFPFAVIGPMKLLRPSRINHIGKLAFRYIYWYMLLPGRPIPFIPNKMSLKGKKIIN